MRPRRITLLALALVAGCPSKPIVSCSYVKFGCHSNPPARTGKADDGNAASTAASSKGDPSIAGRFSWGQVTCDGIAVGLKLDRESVQVGEEISYTLAFSNRSQTSKTLVLFFSLDERFRTRLVFVGSDPNQKIIKAAVRPPIPTGAPFKVEVTLQPGETIEKPGSPQRMDPRLTGTISAFVEYDYNSTEKCTALTGSIQLNVKP